MQIGPPVSVSLSLSLFLSLSFSYSPSYFPPSVPSPPLIVFIAKAFARRGRGLTVRPFWRTPLPAGVVLTYSRGTGKPPSWLELALMFDP